MGTMRLLWCRPDTNRRQYSRLPDAGRPTPLAVSDSVVNCEQQWCKFTFLYPHVSSNRISTTTTMRIVYQCSHNQRSVSLEPSFISIVQYNNVVQNKSNKKVSAKKKKKKFFKKKKKKKKKK